MTKAGHGVQSEGEKIIADRLYDCGIDYIYDSLIEIDGEWIRPDFILPGLNDLIIEYKGMDDFEYNEKFERKLMILAAAGMRVMVLRQRDLEKIIILFIDITTKEKRRQSLELNFSEESFISNKPKLITSLSCSAF